jgi:hypothetical protein
MKHFHFNNDFGKLCHEARKLKKKYSKNISRFELIRTVFKLLRSGNLHVDMCG